MSVHHLEELGLDVARVLAAIDFLESYAAIALAELGDDNPTDDDAWISSVDAATALREAAQWAMCVDRTRGRDLLDRSGALFRELDQPFGMYLHVVSGSWVLDPPVAEFEQPLAALAELAGFGASHAEVSISGPLLHPQQQAYLMLAASALPPVAAEFRSLLRNLAYESPHRIGVVPVGALGMPIRRFWHIARLLAEPGPEALVGLTHEIVTMCGRYAESIELAQANTHCWRSAAAPVDVGDIDILGVVTAAGRRFGVEELANALETPLAEHPYAARAVVEMAMENAGGEPELLRVR